MIFRFIFGFIALVLTQISNAQERSITIHYNIRPPYFLAGTNPNMPGGGELFERLQRIEESSGIKLLYEDVPFPRTLQLLKKGNPNTCSGSAFKTEERERIYSYSFSFFKDKETVSVFKSIKLQNSDFNSLDELLKSNLKPLLKIGFSYGNLVDAKIKEHKSYDHLNYSKRPPDSVLVTSNSPNEMLDMIASGEADYIFIGKNELEYYQKVNRIKGGMLAFQAFDELPKGEKRYFMCSKETKPELIEKLNKAITELGYLED